MRPKRIFCICTWEVGSGQYQTGSETMFISEIWIYRLARSVALFLTRLDYTSTDFFLCRRCRQLLLYFLQIKKRFFFCSRIHMHGQISSLSSPLSSSFQGAPKESLPLISISISIWPIFLDFWQFLGWNYGKWWVL